MYSCADLHCHTTASDGVLSPGQLLALAREQGVELLAVTDHDTVAGVRYLLSLDEDPGLTLVAGTELSCLWGNLEIHVVGLGFQLSEPGVDDCLARQHQARWQRCERIADKVARRLSGVTADQILAGAMALARNAQLATGTDFMPDPDMLQIGRPHLADWLVQEGLVPHREAAFRKYLGHRHMGNAGSHWPHITTVVDWIRGWGGVPVLAHPGKYKLSGMKLRALVEDFARAGGLAMEVVGCLQPWGERNKLAGLCGQYGLAASTGSDFHGPWSDRIRPGRLGPIPEGCRPVWELFDDRILNPSFRK